MTVVIILYAPKIVLRISYYLWFVFKTHIFSLQGDIQDKALTLQAVRVKDVSNSRK
jgi:hypothetical protein